MSNDFVAPIDHSTGSAVAATASGAATGAVSGGWNSFKKGVKYCAIAGLIIGVVATAFSVGLISLPVVVAAKGAAVAHAVSLTGTGLGAQIAQVLTWGAISAAIGGAIGVAAGYITAPFGAIVGAFKGGKHAVKEVKEERGAAHMLEAQLEAYKSANTPVVAEAPVTNVFAPSATNKYNFPAHGSAMNAASPQIMAGNDNMYQGVLAGRQLAASV